MFIPRGDDQSSWTIGTDAIAIPLRHEDRLLDNPPLLRGERRASALARPLGGSVLTAAFRRGQAERQGGFLQGQA